jgi:transposase
MQLLWEEYREANPDGYRYSRYVAAVFMLREHLKAMTVPGTDNVLAT